MTSAEFIRSLTEPQRRAFKELEACGGRRYAPPAGTRRRPYAALIKLNVVQMAYDAGGLYYCLTDLGKLIHGPIACYLEGTPQ